MFTESIIVNSITNNTDNTSSPEYVFKKIQEAINNDKYINLYTGRLVSKYDEEHYYYCTMPQYPFAIRKDIVFDSYLSTLVFEEYINRYSWFYSDQTIHK